MCSALPAPPLESMVRARLLIDTMHSLTASLDVLTAGTSGPSSPMPTNPQLLVGQRPSLFAALSGPEKESFQFKLSMGLLTEKEIESSYAFIVDARQTEALYPSPLAVPPTKEQQEASCGRFQSNRGLIAETVTDFVHQRSSTSAPKQHNGAGAGLTLSGNQEREEGGLTLSGNQERGGGGLTLSGNQEREGGGLTLSGNQEREGGGKETAGPRVGRRESSVSVTSVVREYEEKLVIVSKLSREEGFAAGFLEGQKAAAGQSLTLETELRGARDKLRAHESLANTCFKQREATNGKMALARDQRTQAEDQLRRLQGFDIAQLRVELAALQYERDVFHAAAVKAQTPHMVRLERMLAATTKQMMELFDAKRR